MQHKYFGCDGENAISLNDDCFYVWGSLKCFIYESRVLSPYKLSNKKF